MNRGMRVGLLLVHTGWYDGGIKHCNDATSNSISNQFHDCHVTSNKKTKCAPRLAALLPSL